MAVPEAPRFTIAICTYNRAAALGQVLDDLARQDTIDAGDVEILVVDNRSTDGTSALLQEWSARLPLRFVREERQGTVFARNRALAEARGEITLFLDDDIRIRDGWLAGYRELFAESGVVAAAGPVVSTWPQRIPGWIGDPANPPFPGVTVHYVPGTTRRWIGPDGPHPFTANLGFRTSAGRTIGFREDIGHVRGKMMGGDDMDFCRRFTINVGPILFDPRPTVEHPVEARRMTLAHTFGYLYRGAMAEAWYAPPPASDARIGRLPLWLFRWSLTSLGRAALGAVTFNSRRMIAGCGGVVRSFGFARGLLTGANPRDSQPRDQ